MPKPHSATATLLLSWPPKMLPFGFKRQRNAPLGQPWPKALLMRGILPRPKILPPHGTLLVVSALNRLPHRHNSLLAAVPRLLADALVSVRALRHENRPGNDHHHR